jgi:hypothetical protein
MLFACVGDGIAGLVVDVMLEAVLVEVEVVVGELVREIVWPEPVVVPDAVPVYPVKLGTGVMTAVYEG